MPPYHPDDIPALKARIQELEEENQRFKDILLKAGLLPQEYLAKLPAPSIEQPPVAVTLPPLNERMIKQFFAYFWGRTDVYAKRSA